MANKIALVIVAALFLLCNFASATTLKSALVSSVPAPVLVGNSKEKNILPTPIKLLENLAMLEKEAVAAIYKFNNTIGQTKRLVNNLKLKAKVNRSDVCWQYIGAQIRYRTSVEKDAVSSIQMRYQKLVPLLQKGGKNLTEIFSTMVDEGEKCRARCQLNEFTLETKNDTMKKVLEGHERCAAKISALAAELETKEKDRRAQLEEARAIVKALSAQALEEVAATPINKEKNLRSINVDGHFNRDTNASTHNKNKYSSKMINGESIVDLSKPYTEPKKPGVNMEKVAKLYLKEAETKIVALTKEESELEEALKVMEETYKKLKENYVNPEKAKDMMVADCHTSMKEQKQYFNKMDDKLGHEHAELVASALKEKVNIRNVQQKLDARNHCRAQILYLIGDESPDHVMDDMLARHQISSGEKKKIQHIPYLL